MSYSIIRPPFPLDFDEMPPERLRSYAEWFRKLIPERLSQLAAFVHLSPAHAAWPADLTPGSVDELAVWFASQVEAVQRSPEEVERIRASGSAPIDIPTWELSRRTFSLATDVGMYLGETVLKNVSGTSWRQQQERTVDYGQLVVFGEEPRPFNPVRVTITHAYSVGSGDRAELREVYDAASRRLMSRS